mmetsp:Transcript_8036/g.11643  ORF Transcript_8036/g.11643 Transcript_8036/m.11643 type:complete len:243 (+) Transcript_8036:189-917(+)|eukprot:CAMPEP_0194209254 /NCGR_PEP_ID=MMETSP0156-20130528/7446_1 /TAXON_ID=33649 /ORGANISM="Thalassionema nitzschioides, Strain L26-B" /LENGTH=242 /DNA_ID=CAMNT_0038936391 /DNA_START=148 /DNA_END=876 /DNA_ORIENTATION=+
MHKYDIRLRVNNIIILAMVIMMRCCCFCDAYTSTILHSPSLTLRSTSNYQNYPTKLKSTSVLFAETDEDSSSSEIAGDESSSSNWVSSIWKGIRPNNNDDDKKKKLSTRERLAKMGLATMLSYGFVSNMNSCITVGISWFAFSKKTQLSPLAPNQWKPFLAVYAGFYVASNFLRPFRVALSVGVGPYLDSFLQSVQKRMKVSKGVAVGITVFFFNIILTTSFMAFSVVAASVLAGVPPFPGK